MNIKSSEPIGKHQRIWMVERRRALRLKAEMRGYCVAPGGSGLTRYEAVELDVLESEGALGDWPETGQK